MMTNPALINREGSRFRFASRELPAISALLLLIALRFLPVLLHGLLYAPFRDNVFIYGPMFSETARIALHGEHPFYLPSFGTGFPLFQSPHYSPFYPFYFFGLLDYGGPLRSLFTLTYLTIFHRVILALNFFVMLRCARVSPWASFVGASLGVFAYNTEVYSAWITITASYTWLPLIIAGAILLLREPRRWLGAIILGVAAGMLALASASQAIAHTILFSVMFFGAGAIWLFRKGGVRPVVQLAGMLALAGVIAFGIGGVSAIPVYLGVEGMIRHIGGSYVLGHQHIPWSKFNETQLALTDWSAIFLSPGRVEVVGSPYIGPLGLAGVALSVLFFSRLDSLGRFLALTIGAIGLYALCSAFGTHLGLSYINYHIPLLNKIREAGRHLVLYLMAVVFLSGIGFDQLGKFLQHFEWAQTKHRSFLLGSCVILLIFVGVTVWELVTHAPLAGGGAIVLLLAPVLLVSGLLLRSRACYLFVLLAILVSVASAIAPPRVFPLSVSEYSPPDNIHNLATLHLLRRKLGAGDFRIDFVDAKTSPFTWAMNASYFGFDSFYNRLTPQPYEQFRLSGWQSPPRLREMMGSRYVLCNNVGDKPKDPAAKPLFVINGATLFENPSYMSRITVVHALAGTYSKATDVTNGLVHGFDFRRSIFLQPADALLLTSFLPNHLPGTIKRTDEKQDITIDRVNRVAISLTLSQPGVVVLNEYFIPAWKAKVNGVSQDIVQANQWQVGVPVGAGRNVVEFIYRPTLSWILLILNRVTWFLLAAFVLVRVIRSGLTIQPEGVEQ